MGDGGGRGDPLLGITLPPSQRIDYRRPISVHRRPPHWWYRRTAGALITIGGKPVYLRRLTHFAGGIIYHRRFTNSPAVTYTKEQKCRKPIHPLQCILQRDPEENKKYGTVTRFYSKDLGQKGKKAIEPIHHSISGSLVVATGRDEAYAAVRSWHHYFCFSTPW
jgi:hypothetical protein